jgi:3-demethoxyubiquinol 3-hydroxylase
MYALPAAKFRDVYARFDRPHRTESAMITPPPDTMNAAVPSAKDQVTIRRILKVNHAGEFGAIRIYRSQAAIARLLYPELTGFLSQTLSHEIAHCALFRDAMPQRAARPCRIMALWGTGGSVLGLITALFGPQQIWTCTAAVEATVHRHLEDQLRFLAGKDEPLRAAIAEIQHEELSHLHYAQAQRHPGRKGSRMLYRFICIATETVIWLSTWGDSVTMARAIESPSRRQPFDGP